MNKRVSKKISILAVFALFAVIAMSFVSWLIYAVFSQSYREIKGQYYSVVSKQIVEDIENSIRNGKEIERFYGMDKVLDEMLDIISTDEVPISAAVTDMSGRVLYSSSREANGGSYLGGIIQAEDIAFDEETSYKTIQSGEYEVMAQPICDTQGDQIGVMALSYSTKRIQQELSVQKRSSDMITICSISGTVILLVLYFLILPRSVCVEESQSDGGVESYKSKQRENRFLFLIPVLAIMAGLLVQCVISYNGYQKRYKEVMLEGAQGISEYIGGIISTLHDKGVAYERMNGLSEYLADKVTDSSLLWNVSVVGVYADTADILAHSSEYSVALELSSVDEITTCINVEISKDYIDEKMFGMLLVFVVTFAVALIMIIEILRLPDALFTRLSRQFRTSQSVQAEACAPMLRIGAFITYTGLYAATPFSSVLITQWNKGLFGLPVTFLASIPMTAELLSTMLCSLLCLPLYKKLNLKLVFAGSVIICSSANLLCFLAESPEQLILLRFMSGIGFAGIKYSMNTFVANGSLTAEQTRSSLAELNAGLLGGITCGGTLGATIASSVNVHTAYLVSGIFMLFFLIVVVVLAPWVLLCQNKSETIQRGGESVFKLIFKPSFLRYMLMVALPMNFGLMFVVAFFPAYVGAMGLPDVTTSYGYLLNGLIGIYLGPVLLKAVSTKLGRTACTVISLFLGAGAVFLLNISVPLAAVLLCVAVLGLFDGFGTPATSDYYVNMPDVQKTGVNQGLAVLNVVGSTVQTFSPVLYSLVLTSGKLGANVVGIIFAATAVLFIVTMKIGSGKKIGNQH